MLSYNMPTELHVGDKFCVNLQFYSSAMWNSKFANCKNSALYLQAWHKYFRRIAAVCGSHVKMGHY